MNASSLFFAQPQFSNGIWIWAGFLLLLIWLDRRGSGALDRLVSRALQARLVTGPSTWRRRARLALLGLAGLAMIVALMQPQTGMRYVTTPRVGAEIMIALDISRSMLADDAKPSRLARAKAEISDLLAYLDDDYVGLIAFAGRASVLSPMTPDKSFLRLALDSAGPHSVTRGGTRLAEPIRRAVAGMGEQGPAQRALILITDGEDHDSFAVDAAKAAAEAGIKIITIGFGDETGSQIYLRDPNSGARSLLRDGEGRAVVSRLDGDLLREIALVTDGAFVPAGTGVLDLASIYETHIAALTRGQLDERGRTIRDEAFQFFVLLAIVCLIGAVSIAAGRRRNGATTFLAMLMCAMMAASAVPLRAEAQTSGSNASTGSPTEGGVDETPARPDDRDDPRERFNRANAVLKAGDAVAAAALLREARRDAVDDAALRYAATYNLGIAAVARADGLLSENREEALAALYEAADWFREAAAARPEATEPRHNLDVTLRRALILADEMATENQEALEATLDSIILVQRDAVRASAGLLERVVREGELDAAEALRPAFRAAATDQRLIRAEANTLAERVDRERQKILETPEGERTPEDTLRAGQLDAVLFHLDAAIDRMGQTRRQLRQRRAERAYRRASNALGELKRARDQLRHPIEQIGILLREVGQLARSTQALRGAGLATDAPLPAFLTAESVERESAQIQARVEELADRFAGAAEQALQTGGAPMSSDPAQADPVEAMREASQRTALIEAEPLVGEAAAAMARVTDSLGTRRLETALDQEIQAGESLAAAQERFFELKQLLNATFDAEAQIAGLAQALFDESQGVRDPGEEAALDPSAWPEIATTLTEAQRKNLARALRLEAELDLEERIRLKQIEGAGGDPGQPATPAPPAHPDEGEPDPAELERQRFDLARQRLALASGAMMETTDALGKIQPSAPQHWGEAASAAQRAAEQLDGIRSLFFSLVEHVRQLAIEQVDTQDRTEEAIALSVAESAETPEPTAPAPPATPPASAPSTRNEDAIDSSGLARGPETLARAGELATEQAELEARAQQIADALSEQAEQVASGPAEEAGPEAEDDALRIRQAGEKVASAGLAMKDAVGSLAAESGLLDPARDAQELAVEDLQAALALLSPPPESSNESDESENEDESPSEQEQEPGDASEGSDQQNNAEQAPPEATEEGMDDPSQLLQGVRDREAERRRDQDERQQRRRAEPVEKDW